MRKILIILLLTLEFTIAKSLNANNFHSTISKKGVVIVKFWATWCTPCKMLTPEFNKAKKIVGDRAIFATYNVDNRGKPLKQYNISTIPTMVLFENGKEVDRSNSILSAKDITDWVLGYIPK